MIRTFEDELPAQDVKINEKLWTVIDRIFKLKPVLVSKWRISVFLFKSYLIQVISKCQSICFLQSLPLIIHETRWRLLDLHRIRNSSNEVMFGQKIIADILQQHAYLIFRLERVMKSKLNTDNVEARPPIVQSCH